MLQTFTLDTNCIIDVAKKRPAAPAVQALADAHTAGRADVAVVQSLRPKNSQTGITARILQNFTTV